MTVLICETCKEIIYSRRWEVRTYNREFYCCTERCANKRLIRYDREVGTDIAYITREDE